jgi:hypothetical protein
LVKALWAVLSSPVTMNSQRNATLAACRSDLSSSPAHLLPTYSISPAPLNRSNYTNSVDFVEEHEKRRKLGRFLRQPRAAWCHSTGSQYRHLFYPKQVFRKIRIEFFSLRDSELIKHQSN